jgi:hypothetical protein
MKVNVSSLEAEKKLRIALIHQMPSPELAVIGKILSGLGAVVSLPDWSAETHREVYDLGVCVGPTRICPLAKRRALFVLGQTIHHLSADWDAVVVTSEKAKTSVFRRFGRGCRVIVAPPPLLGLEAARRRIVEQNRQLLHVSEGGISLKDNVTVFRVWGDFPFHADKPVREDLYCHLGFNSLVNAGAIGFYPDSMEDGYDIQVRRHLAFGGPVVCRRDKLVLGDLADLCCDVIPTDESKKITPVNCSGSESGYNETITAFLSRVK